MASTYSELKIELIGTGEQSGTWGSTTNVNLGTAIEEAITGQATVSFSSSDIILTLTNTNATQVARHLKLDLTGTSGGARVLTVPTFEKQYIINNGLADACTVKTAGGTGISVPAGKSMVLFVDGINVVDTTTHLSSLTLATDLAVADGGTGASTAADARTNLGLGSIATQNSDAVSITGGTVGGTTAINTSGTATLTGTVTSSGTLNVTGDFQVDGAAGTNGQVLTSAGSGTPTWTTLSADPTMGGDLSGTASNAQIVANAVGTTEIANNAVTADKIAADAVGSSEIAANAVGTSEIANSAVTNAKLGTDSVTAAKIAANAVGASEIAANAVGASELNVSGNGNTSQYLRADGDGTFTWATPPGTSAFPANTRLAFRQSSAPTGWTKETAANINNALLRLVTGNVSQGGAANFSTWNSQQTSGAHTLSVAQIPSHTHNYFNDNDSETYNGAQQGDNRVARATSATGGNGSHTHSVAKNIKYYDFIVARKN